MTCIVPATYIQSAESSELGSFFSSLFREEKREHYCREVLNYTKKLDLSLLDFPKATRSYSRNIIARDEAGFEGMIIRWDRGIAGAVHGHPDYAFYHLVSGRIGVEHFTMGTAGPEPVTSCIMEPGDHFCVEGVAGRFDNAIHRITALEESLSVHMYSNDALLGKCYDDYPLDSQFLEQSGAGLLVQDGI
ncbi:cupin domain-containing protein [Desulforhopalus sp. 52FAK]